MNTAATEPSTDARLDRLAALRETLPDGLSPGEAAVELVARALHAIEADVGFVARVEGDNEELVVSRVTRHAHQPVRLVFPLDAPYPLAEAIRTREPLFIASNEELVCKHPGLERVMSEDHACATLPLFVRPGRRLVGALNVAFEDPHEFSEAEHAVITALARHCSELLAAQER